MNFYNDIKSAQAPLAGNSCGQLGCGMLGREPTPFQAILSWLGFALGLPAHVLDGGKFQSRDVLRMTGRPSGHSGSNQKTASRSSREAAWISSWLGIPPDAPVSIYENYERSRRVTGGGTHQSKPIYSPVPGEGESTPRNNGTRGHPPRFRSGGIFATCLCISVSSIFDGCESQAFRARTGRIWDYRSSTNQAHLFIYTQ